MRRKVEEPKVVLQEEIRQESMRLSRTTTGVIPHLVKEPEVHEFPRGDAVENGDHQGLESHARSLMKALSWRVTALVITVGIVWMITGAVRLAAMVGTVDALLKIGAYYLHERAWNRSNFGRRGR